MALEKYFSVDEAAARLRKTSRWLRDWLASDGHGYRRPYGRLAGRTLMLNETDIRRIETAIQSEAAAKALQPSIIERPGHVYFIDGGDVVKIGFTRSPEARLKKMATDAPVPLMILHVEDGTFQTEKVIHRHFAAIRVRGEWFRKTPELMEYIATKIRIRNGVA